MGADLALRLYERYVKTCQDYQLSPLLLDRIKGDISLILVIFSCPQLHTAL